jgi:hypothetical protein
MPYRTCLLFSSIRLSECLPVFEGGGILPDFGRLASSAVRYADDNIIGFQYRSEAERFLRELKERLLKFGLELHPDKARLVEFGQFAEQDRKRRGEGKPDTFDFLGFTHISGKDRNGKFAMKRHTSGKRMRVKLAEIKLQLRERMHDPVALTGTCRASGIMA